jgi:hypothetical protein
MNRPACFPLPLSLGLLAFAKTILCSLARMLRDIGYLSAWLARGIEQPSTDVCRVRLYMKKGVGEEHEFRHKKKPTCTYLNLRQKDF